MASSNVEVGFITGASTVAGVLITALGNGLHNRHQRKREDKTRWDKERLLLYSEFLSEATGVEYKIQTHDALGPLRQIGFRVKLVASSDVAQAVDDMMDYFERLRKFINEAGPDEEEVRRFGLEEELQRALSQCVGFMTKDLGVTPAVGMTVISQTRKPWWRSWPPRGDQRGSGA